MTNKNYRKILREAVELLVEALLKESKQQIINLGFPEVIASILYEKYGKNATLFAK